MKKINIIFIVLSCLFFLAVALYKLGGEFPPGLNHDGAWNTLYAIRILNGDPSTKTPYAPEAYGRETLYHYTSAIFLRLFGIKKEVIEITGAFFGLLSVLLVYKTLSMISRNRVYAFLFTLMWSSSSALIVYARSGWRLITLIPAVVFLMLFINHYLMKKNLISAFGIGLSSGIILYTYNGGRLIPVFLFGFWLIAFVINKDKKTIFFNGLVSLSAFLVISMSMIRFALNNWVIFFGRATTLTEGNSLSTILSNIKTSLLFYNRAGNGGDFITNFPALEGPVSILWIIGILLAFYKLNKYWAYLLLFIVLWLPSIVTSPSFHRSVGTLPLVYFFAFFLVLEALNLFKNKFPRKKLAVLLLIVFIQIFTSIYKLYIEKKPFQGGFYPKATRVGHYINMSDSDNFVIYAGNWPKDILTFLTIDDYSSYKASSEIANNYENYNSPSHDGLIEMVSDLEVGKITANARFIVEKERSDKFISVLEEKEFKTKQIDTVVLESGEPVAYVYKILLSSN